MQKSYTFLYKNRKVSIQDIAELKKVSKHSINVLLKGLELDSDVTDLVSNYTPKKYGRVFLVDGEILTILAISKKYNLIYSTLHARLRGVESLSDVSDIVTDLVTTTSNKRYIVFGEELTISEFATKYCLSFTTLYNRVVRSGREKGSDISDLVDATDRRASEDIEEYMIKLTGDKSVGGTGIEWCNKSAFAFLGYPTRKGVSYITKEVLLRTNYEGRKALGFDKACRSKWLTDNLWIYECPDCGKHLVLTTEEIINHKHGDMCNTHSTEEIVEERSY